MKLDLNKPLRMKDSKQEARVVFDSSKEGGAGSGYLAVRRTGSRWAHIKDACGGSWLSVSDLEARLENTPEERTGYLNVYDKAYGDCVYDTRAEADSGAASYRIACVKVTYNYTPGQFDE